MVPATIRKQLGRLRRREKLLRLAWGASRWLALAAAVLALACLTDWLIDRVRDTPWPLRAFMSFFQVGLWATAAFFLVLRPLFARLSDSKLALWVEGKAPHLEHRLISTVQFHQPAAKTEGMSRELIAAVARETEQLTAAVNFPAVADHRRLKWSGAAVAPVLLAALLALVLMPNLLMTLLARQLLNDVPIPRSIYLRPDTAEVWPSGEEVVLRFRVWGSGLDPDIVGRAYVSPIYGPMESYELVYEAMATAEEAIFAARVRPLSVDFTYGAELLDGRTPSSGRIHFEPRPAVVRQEAWVVLPAYCGSQADGSPYELPQPRGEIVGLSGLSARVTAGTQKPVKEAVLELLGTPYPDLSQPSRESAAQRSAVEAVTTASALALAGAPSGAGLLEGVSALVAGRGEVVLRRLRQTFRAPVTEAHWTFELRPTETRYRIHVVDQYDFANAAPALRSVAVVPERAPQVALLRERFLPPKAFLTKGANEEDFEVDGMPLALDEEGNPGSIRIAYTVSGPYGLGRAQLRYRVHKKVEGSQQETPPADDPWLTLPLIEVKESPKGGPFDLARGVFTDTDEKEQVPFHALAVPRPPFVVPRSQGGGRFEFETANLLDAKGEKIVLKAGDQVEFFVEVFNRNPDRAEAVAGRSETRVKTVVTAEEFVRWVLDTLQEESRLRQLEQRQRGVFDAKQ